MLSEQIGLETKKVETMEAVETGTTKKFAKTGS